MLGIIIDFARDHEGHIRPLGRLDRQVNALLRADAGEHQRKIPFGMADVQGLCRDAIANGSEKVSKTAAIRLLGLGHAIEPGVRPIRLQSVLGIPGNRQMQRDKRRWPGRRHIGVKVHPVQMHQVDRPGRQSRCDGLLLGGPDAAAAFGVDGPDDARDRNQCAARFGPRAGNYERAVTGRHQRRVQIAEDLLRAPGRVRPDRGEGIGDIQYAQDHVGARSRP